MVNLRGLKDILSHLKRNLTENNADEFIQSEEEEVDISSTPNTNSWYVDSLIRFGKMSASIPPPPWHEIIKRIMKILICIHYFSEWSLTWGKMYLEVSDKHRTRSSWLARNFKPTHPTHSVLISSMMYGYVLLTLNTKSLEATLEKVHLWLKGTLRKHLFFMPR